MGAGGLSSPSSLFTVSTDVKARVWDLSLLMFGTPLEGVDRKCGHCRGLGYVDGAHSIGTEVQKMRSTCWKCGGSGLAEEAQQKLEEDFDPLERAFEMHAAAQAKQQQDETVAQVKSEPCTEADDKAKAEDDKEAPRAHTHKHT